MSEPAFAVPAPRGSDAWQEGRQFIYLTADELTAEDFDAMDASERAFALQWMPQARRSEAEMAENNRLRELLRAIPGWENAAANLDYFFAERGDLALACLANGLDISLEREHTPEKEAARDEAAHLAWGDNAVAELAALRVDRAILAQGGYYENGKAVPRSDT